MHFPMHFSSWLISSFLLAPLAPGVLAAPREFRRSPLDLAEKHTDTVSDVNMTMTKNLAGAAWVRDPGTFHYVFGTLEVPALSGDNGTVTNAWIGIDGMGTCGGVAFQAGIRLQHIDYGPKYQPWYLWQPSYVRLSHEIDIGIISPGDVIDIAVMLPTNKTYGVVMFNNRNTNGSYWQDIQSSNALCLTSAEWMVQSYVDTTLANFGTIAFENATAIGKGGDLYHPLEATIYDIQRNGTNLTSVSVDENAVTIKYTGT